MYKTQECLKLVRRQSSEKKTGVEHCQHQSVPGALERLGDPWIESHPAPPRPYKSSALAGEETVHVVWCSLPLRGGRGQRRLQLLVRRAKST